MLPNSTFCLACKLANGRLETSWCKTIASCTRAESSSHLNPED